MEIWGKESEIIQSNHITSQSDSLRCLLNDQEQSLDNPGDEVIDKSPSWNNNKKSKIGMFEVSSIN